MTISLIPRPHHTQLTWLLVSFPGHTTLMRKGSGLGGDWQVWILSSATLAIMWLFAQDKEMLLCFQTMLGGYGNRTTYVITCVGLSTFFMKHGCGLFPGVAHGQARGLMGHVNLQWLVDYMYFGCHVSSDEYYHTRNGMHQTLILSKHSNNNTIRSLQWF